MNLQEFHNGLRLLGSLDLMELQAVGLWTQADQNADKHSDPGNEWNRWERFRDNPQKFFAVHADDETIDKIWGAMKNRLNKIQHKKVKVERAVLGVDGNAGFALLGEDLQSGEAEFVEIALPVEASKDQNRYHNSDWVNAAKRASTLAYRALQARFPERKISYALGPSHPDYC